MQRKFQYIFGPVYSWRLGVSVGIDLLSADQKICNFNCEYCQLGETHQFQSERKVFVETEKVIEEIQSFPEEEFDYFTFSSSGEPTLARNIGEVISRLKEQFPSKKIAVITNSSLIRREDVQNDLLKADFVLAKIDASDEDILQKVNGPTSDIHLEDILAGIQEFQALYKGKLALQIMFVDNNKEFAQKIAEISRNIDPCEVQINTPLRPSSSKPLSEKDLEEIKSHFVALDLNCRTVYEAKRQEIEPISVEDTQKRHGKLTFSEEEKS